jgi:hypothetical protein
MIKFENERAVNAAVTIVKVRMRKIAKARDEIIS